MEVSQLLQKDTNARMAPAVGAHENTRPHHPYPTRQGSTVDSVYMHTMSPYDQQPAETLHIKAEAPVCTGHLVRGAPKQVTFNLHGTRRTLRVNVKANEDTDKIISAVKNHFGAYHGDQVEFEDAALGQPITAHYDNWPHNGKVTVSFIPQPAAEPVSELPQDLSLAKPTLAAPFQMSPSHVHAHRPGTKPEMLRCPSPATGLRNSLIKAQPSPKTLALLTDVHRDYDFNGNHSDSDVGSISSSRRARSDQLANPDISTENIVGGTRRIPQVAKFESSELPLFKPPQMPITASISSASPQRRNNNGFAASPLPPHSFNVPPQLLSPQSFGIGEAQAYGSSGARETRSTGRVSGMRMSGGSSSGLLPTPAPTVGSIISDEDVAYQLMRLGDPSNYRRDRTSTSTMADDALSGKADLASSVEYSDDDDMEDDADDDEHDDSTVQDDSSHHHKKRRLNKTMINDVRTRESSADDTDVKSIDQRAGKPAVSRNGSSTQQKRKKRAHSPTKSNAKTSTASSVSRTLPPASRKASMSSIDHHGSVLAEDEEDLSSKPRCQRCRKSKKGCDRQRPCQRCKDAGIGVDGCVSEDDSNGRKGRFGRHMGVAIKKADATIVGTAFAHNHGQFHGHAIQTQDDHLAGDKSKKRKR